MEKDGSFFRQSALGNRHPLRTAGPCRQSNRRRKSWFWTRRGEQRVCVGCHAGPERAPENAVPEVLAPQYRPGQADSAWRPEMKLRSLPIALLCVSAFAQQPIGPIRFEEVAARAGSPSPTASGAAKLDARSSKAPACRRRLVRLQTTTACSTFTCTSGKPLGPGLHPYPLRKAPQTPATNHLYRNDGKGRFTDVTQQAGVAGDLFSTWPPLAADYDNDGHTDLPVTGSGTRHPIPKPRATARSRISPARPVSTFPGWSIGRRGLVPRSRPGCVDLFVGRSSVRPGVSLLLRRRQLSGPLDYEPTTRNLLFPQQLQGRLHPMRAKQPVIAKFKSRAMGVAACRFRPRRLPGYLRRERQDRELPLPQPKRTEPSKRSPSRRRSLRTKRREHFRHGTGLRGPRRRAAVRTCG